ncbi:hypothetical protein [Roseovarius gaetbuli]|nr:hypothetical protein [Roseovarius gaetbuli]
MKNWVLGGAVELLSLLGGILAVFNPTSAARLLEQLRDGRF